MQPVDSEDKREVTLEGARVNLVAGLNALCRLWPAIDEWPTECSL